VTQILALFVFSLAAYAQVGVLPMRFANLPACAGPSADPRPKAETDGSFLLLRVQDPSGVGVEIWCAKESAGFNYQYRLASPDGASRRLDRCELPNGINSVGVDHEGPVNEAALPNGGQWLRTGGRITRFFHHNWDERRGHHTFYDVRRQILTTYSTVALQDAAGRWVRAIEGVKAVPINGVMQRDFPIAMGKNLPERTFDPNRVTCLTALADEGLRIHEEEVNAFVGPQQAGKLTVAWPESSPIEKLDFDAARRELRIKLIPSTRKAIVSIAFPRTMLGLGRELSHVRLDGQFVESDEVTTETHKSIRFRIDETVKEVLLTESSGFPFFAVTGLALVGAIIIGGVIGMLFRRKLPAVQTED